MKAKYIGKTADREYIYLEYEYKGETYEIYIHKSKGGEPLSWQHAQQQARIDQLIEVKEKTEVATESVEESLNYFFSLI